MNKQRWLIIFGYLLGLGLVITAFGGLDWMAFFAVLKTVKPSWSVAAGVAISMGLMMRALRWNLLVGISLQEYGHFWRVANIGQLGNLILPARAGEVLRMIAISRFTPVSIGQAASSAIADRVSDGVMLIVFMMVVFTIHGVDTLGSGVLIGTLGMFGTAVIFIGAFVLWGQRWQDWVSGWAARLPDRINRPIIRLYVQSLEGIQTLQRPSLLLVVGSITLAAFLMDYAAMWLILRAFGWSLPFSVAITVGVFIAAGASLPALPGYVGIYQVASLLALGLYGINQEQAVAFSVMLHVIGWIVISLQGGLSALSYGFNLSSFGTSMSGNVTNELLSK